MYFSVVVHSLKKKEKKRDLKIIVYQAKLLFKYKGDRKTCFNT